MENNYYQIISVIEKVVDKSLFEELYYYEPFVCKLILDKFKSYLEDPDFDTLERQLILFKFLKNNYPLELSREVVKHAQNCPYHEDYNRVIMEWNYSCSDYIKQASLLPYDCAELAFDKETKIAYDFHRQKMNKQIDLITDITNSLMNNNQE